MALSNIIREPRREITETLLGILVIAPYVLFDYKITTWFLADYTANDRVTALILTFVIIVPIVTLIVVALIVGLHNIGEAAANSLEKNGVRLRPRRRY